MSRKESKFRTELEEETGNWNTYKPTKIRKWSQNKTSRERASGITSFSQVFTTPFRPNVIVSNVLKTEPVSELVRPSGHGPIGLTMIEHDK